MEIYREITEIYKSLPSLECGECWGECCVSPTMTAPEFVLMMRTAQEQFTPTAFENFLKQPAREHRWWEGNHYCRFQNQQSGRCEVYLGRALACRLHGHEALRSYENPDMVFCDKNPDPHKNLDEPQLEKHLEIMRRILDALPLRYEAPWFISSMNLDCWLDFYFTQSLSEGRIELEALWQFLHQELAIEGIVLTPTTTLKGKLNTIEKFWLTVQEESWEQSKALLHSLENDFPSTGSYFLEEIRFLNEWVSERIAIPTLIEKAL